jgi:hypothetical protein
MSGNRLLLKRLDVNLFKTCLDSVLTLEAPWHSAAALRRALTCVELRTAELPSAVTMETSANRRQALKFGVLACVSSLCGCGIGTNDTSVGEPASSTPSAAPGSAWSEAPPPAPELWDPSPWLVLSSSEETVTLDMSITLPAGVRRGGLFGLAADSRSLPAGAKLTPAGILSIDTSEVGYTSDLVFTYVEPVG